VAFLDYFKKDKKEDLDQGLDQTKKSFFSKITKAIAGKSSIDVSVLDDIEEALITSDVSLQTTVKIIDRLEARIKEEKYFGEDELYKVLEDEIARLMYENNTEDIQDFVPNSSEKPYVIMVVGVNGVGKTTTIGKLAHQYKQAGKNVLLGAGDTFRAAAVNQLKIWAERSDVPIVDKGQDADPSSVAFDTLQSAKAKGSDIVLFDTAGRLHTKAGLMQELTKIKSTMSKVIPNAPHEVLLVLDASTGQNALNQAKEFTAATQVNAIALTKIDGTAKGGIAISISDQFKVPIKYIGVGEKIEQLQLFNKKAFIQSLFAKG
jgi:fused signal recognition particle receptor